jgi:hypothetical protein
VIRCNIKHLEARCRERGYTLDDVRPCIVAKDGDAVTVDETHAAYPRARKTRGPGTELKTLLKDWLGIEATPTCSCNRMSARMDALGPDWCESDAGMAEILHVMREEHAKRRAAGQTILPWTDFGATQLVRLACRRGRTT